ncbi:MAG: multidrug effflux MFS transporter [Actinoplanes sp.]
MTAALPARTLIVLGALSAFGPLSLDLYLPALPELAGDLHTSDATAQLTMSSCMVGLALGQLLTGPLSDRFGRRRPLLIGVAAYALTSLLCALAPNVGLLIGVRLIQGLAGGAGIVIARAIVRDRSDTDTAAHVFSMLMLVTGIAPVIAPVLGGQLLRVVPWPGLFVALAGIGCLLLAAAALMIRETLTERSTGGLAIVPVLRDRRFTGFTTVLALGSAVLFLYIAMSPFVLQHDFRLSAQQFSLVFAGNSVGLMAGGRLGAALIRRRGARWTLHAGVTAGASLSALLLIAVRLDLGLPGILPLLLLAVGSVALVLPSATALALDAHGTRAGTASGLIGLAQFGFGAAAAPLVTTIGATATVMAAAMTGAGGIAVLVDRLIARPGPD